MKKILLQITLLTLCLYSVAQEKGKDYTETAFGINMRMIYVEGGTFDMGCTGDRPDGVCFDKPSYIRRTTVSSYYIGMLEVSQRQWFSVMDPGRNLYEHYDYLTKECYKDTTPDGKELLTDGVFWYYPLTSVGGNYPMYFISYEEIESFLSLLSRESGKNYVLPTEAQWEYAARGGNKARITYYAGSDTLENVGWYAGNSNGSLHTCGTLNPNELGLYDMSGNVWEWCRDFWADGYLQYDTVDPSGPETEWMGYGTPFIIRGGGWMDPEENCYVIRRNSESYFGRYTAVGFRVVCIPE